MGDARERYLTTKDEQHIKRELESLYSYANNNRNDSLDLEIVPYLKRLNAVRGIVTLQSCAGHIVDGYILNAHLRVWCTREWMLKIYHDAPKLADHEGIEEVKIHFLGPAPIREVVDIWFNGMPNIIFYGVCEHIVKFLEKV